MHTGSTKGQIPRFYLDTTTVLFRYDCYMIRVRGFNGSYSECRKYRFTKKGEFLMPDVLDIWNRFFHTRYLCSHFFFRKSLNVLILITKNWRLYFRFQFLIKENYLWLNLVNERILHIFEIWYIFILMMLDSIFSKIVSNTWCLDIHKYIWRLLWLTSWVNCSSLYV